MARLSDSIAVTASVLKKGQPAIFPTETVYGLGVSIRHAASPDILYSLKRREKAKPISWLVSQQSDLARFGRRSLHQAQTCMVCSLTQELGVDGYGIKSRGALAKGQELLICGDVHAPPESWLAHSCAG